MTTLFDLPRFINQSFREEGGREAFRSGVAQDLSEVARQICCPGQSAEMCWRIFVV